jgi:diguanylate cyclase (GGDEF)-like protein
LPRAHLIDRHRLWRSAALVLGVAAVLTGVEALARPSLGDSTLLSGLFPLVGAPLAWRFGPRLSARASYRLGRVFLLLALCSAAVSVYNWRGTPVSGAMAFHFVLAAIFAALFFGPRDVLEVLFLSGALAAGALIADGYSTEDLLVWLLMMLAVGGAGLVLNSAVVASEELSYGDPLTGAANRRAWDLAVENALAEHRRRGLPLSVLLLDIDNFKLVNDTAGHDGGDAVLRAAVTAWRQVTRAADTLARLGGDEFGLLLPGCDHAGAMRLGEQMLNDVRRAAEVTCSVGVATVTPGAEAGLLMVTADAQLYAAKDAGRGRVHGAVVPAGALRHLDLGSNV